MSDFGLAKQFDSLDDLTQEGSQPGTFRYMSPEQIEGRAELVSSRTDIFALGVILFELLTGEVPFHGNHQAELRKAILHDEPRWPGTSRHLLPQNLVAICLKCLQKDPAARYAHASGLANDLQSFLKGKPVTARIPTWPERTFMWCQRNPLAAALSATSALLVLVAVGIGAYAWQRAEADLVVVETERNRADFSNYAYLIHSAWHAFQQGDLPEARRLLDLCVTSKDCWEHRLLSSAIDGRLQLSDRINSSEGWLVAQKAGNAHDIRVVEVQHLDRSGSLALVVRTIAGDTGANVLSETETTRYQWIREPLADKNVTVRYYPICIAPAPVGRHLVISTRDELLDSPFGGDPSGDPGDDDPVLCWTQPDDAHEIDWGSREVITSALAWHPSGKWLAAACADGDILTYDPVQRRVATVSTGNKRLSPLEQIGIKYAPTGDLVLIGRNRNLVRMVVLETDSDRLDAAAFGTPFKAADYADDNRTWFDSQSNKSPLLEISSDGRWFAVATEDGLLCLGKLKDRDEKASSLYVTGAPLGKREILLGCKPTAMSFGSQGELAIGDSEGWISVWAPTYRENETKQPIGEVSAWTQKRRIRVSTHEIRALTYDTPNSLRLYSAGGELLTLNFSPEHVSGEFDWGGIPLGWIGDQELVTLHNGWSGIRSFAAPGEETFHPDLPMHRTVARNASTGELWSASCDIVWTLKPGKGIERRDLDDDPANEAYKQRPYESWGKGQFTYSLFLAPRTRRVAMVHHWNGHIAVWNADTGKVVHCVPFSHQPVDWPTCGALTPDESRLLVGTWGGAIRVLDMRSFQWLAEIRGGNGPIHRIDLADDSTRYCAIALTEPYQEGRTDQVYEARFGRIGAGDHILTIELTRRGAESSLLSGDGSRFFTSPHDGAVEVCDTTYGARLGTLRYDYQPPIIRIDTPRYLDVEFPRFSLNPAGNILALLYYEGKTFYWRCERN